MKTDLLFDFNADRNTNSITVRKEFASGLASVWDAFTKPQILDQWWAPAPWVSKTKHMEFEVGGRRFYAMCGPDGQEQWAVQDFTSISPKTNFQYYDAFADKDENITSELPGSEWNVDFSDANGISKVDIRITLKKAADLDAMMQSGFEEGFTATLTYLGQHINDLDGK